MTISAQLFEKQISQITASLIEAGACVEQTHPSLKTRNSDQIVTFGNSDNISIALKNLPYKVVYSELKKNKSYNIQMLDGALIQLMYYFTNGVLTKHRLSFYPSPYLEDYKIAQEVYTKDFIYGDIVRDTITPFPIRFDYSNSESECRDIFHSKSHMTLGEFTHCRIPVSSPLTPYSFISFILKHFYFEDNNPIINSKVYSKCNIILKNTLSEIESNHSFFKV